MKIKTTNMDIVHDKAICLLYYDVTSVSKELPFIVSHPFTNSNVSIEKDTFTILNLFDEEDCAKWRKQLESIIQEASLERILFMLNNPYILTFLSMVYHELSPEDLGMALRDNWSRVEFISDDVNVSTPEKIKMFKTAGIQNVLCEKELHKYEKLPDVVTVYRGVNAFNKNRKKAMSWTLERSVAEWFSKKLDNGTENQCKGTGEVWEIQIPKQRILAYFDKRGESEVVLDLLGFSEPYNVT